MRVPRFGRFKGQPRGKQPKGTQKDSVILLPETRAEKTFFSWFEQVFCRNQIQTGGPQIKLKEERGAQSHNQTWIFIGGHPKPCKRLQF